MHAIADREAFRIGNGSQVRTFGREDPVGPRLVLLARRRRQIFQLNKLQRDRLVTDRGEQQPRLAVREERDFTGNYNVVGIFCDRTPIDESEIALPVICVKADSDTVAVGLLGNFERRRCANLEFQLKAFAIEFRRFIRQQIWHTACQTRNATKDQERPNLAQLGIRQIRAAERRPTK